MVFSHTPYMVKVVGISDSDRQLRLTYCKWYLQRAAGPTTVHAFTLFLRSLGFRNDRYK